MIATKISNTVSGNTRTVKFRLKGTWYNGTGADINGVLKAYWYYEDIIEAGTQVIDANFTIPKRHDTGGGVWKDGEKPFSKVIVHQISSNYDPDAIYSCVAILEAGNDDPRTGAYRLAIKVGGGPSGAWDHPKKPKSMGDDWDGDIKTPFEMATS